MYSVSVLNNPGAFPTGCTESYYEQKIINYTGEEVYLINNANKIIKVPKSNVSCGHLKRIEIQFRWVHGVRKKSTHHSGEELTAPITKITIPRIDLLSSPVFVKEINLLFCLATNYDNYMHPQSESTYERYVEKIQESLMADIKSPPLVIHANDPNCRINKLYFIVNNNLCSFRVTNIVSEDPKCIVGFKTDVDLEQYTYTSLDLENIISGNGTSELNGSEFYISPNKNIINNKLVELKCNEKPDDMLDMEAIRKKFQSHYKDKLIEMEEELKIKKSQYKNMVDNHEETKKRHAAEVSGLQKIINGMNANNAKDEELRSKELKSLLETNAVLNQQIEDQFKLWKRKQDEELIIMKNVNDKKTATMSLITNIVKTTTILVPIVATTVMYFLKKEKAK